MAQYNLWFNTNLQSAPQVQSVHGNFFTADNAGAVIGAHVMDGSAPATLSGAVTGYIIRADGNTVVVNGTLSGNDVSITLPESAVAVPGQVQAVLRLISGSVKTVLLAVSGYVQRSATDAIIDPGHVVPSLDELLARISEMEQATAAANTAAAETGRVNITQTKSGEVITITTTDRNNRTSSNTVTDPVTRLLLLSDSVPNTTQSITYGTDGNVSQILHSNNGQAVRTDTFTFTDSAITENRVLAGGGSLTMVTNLETLQTTVTYSA